MKSDSADREQSPMRLQPGWRCVRLGEVCDLLPSRSLASNGDVEVRAVTTACLTESGFCSYGIKTARMHSGDALASRLVAGEVLIARSNTPDLVGRTAMYSGVPDDIVASDLTIRISPSPPIRSEYLSLYLQSLFCRGYWREASGGASASMKKITRTQVAALEIPIPPLPEQIRIAAILDEQMSAVEKARAAAEAQLKSCEALIESFLRKSKSGCVLKKTRLAECLSEVTAGIGKSWSRYPLYGVTRSGIAPAKEALGKNPERYKPVTPGTVFYNPMRILLGSIALADNHSPPGITSPDYVVVRAIEGTLHPEWFYYWLRSMEGAVFIKSLTRGAVRERILFKRLSVAEIPMPPWKRQVECAGQLSAVKSLAIRCQAQLDALAPLPAVLLRRAFSGEL